MFARATPPQNCRDISLGRDAPTGAPRKEVGAIELTLAMTLLLVILWITRR